MRYNLDNFLTRITNNAMASIYSIFGKLQTMEDWHLVINIRYQWFYRNFGNNFTQKKILSYDSYHMEPQESTMILRRKRKKQRIALKVLLLSSV